MQSAVKCVGYLMEIILCLRGYSKLQPDTVCGVFPMLDSHDAAAKFPDLIDSIRLMAVSSILTGPIIKV